jgi:hypothetical protein
VLRDGATVQVRPIRPDDEARLLSFLRLLSPDSRLLRFFSAGVDLSAAAQRDANVDYGRTFGLVAVSGPGSESSATPRTLTWAGIRPRSPSWPTTIRDVGWPRSCSARTASAS